MTGNMGSLIEWRIEEVGHDRCSFFLFLFPIDLICLSVFMIAFRSCLQVSNQLFLDMQCIIYINLFDVWRFLFLFVIAAFYKLKPYKQKFKALLINVYILFSYKA